MVSIPNEKRRFSFSRGDRLLSSEEFANVFSNVQYRASNRQFVLIARRNELSRNRIGFVLSKKNAKRAVDRNRFRRVHREHFRIEFNRCVLGYDVVVLLRKKGNFKSDNARIPLSAEVAKLWTKLLESINGSPSD